MTAGRGALPVTAPREPHRGAGNAGRPRRAAALLAALVMPLAACSLLPLQPDEPTERVPSAETTNGPSGDTSDFAATCTGEGRLQTRGSTQGTDHETQNSQGESFRYGVVMIQPEDGSEPSAELRLQLPGGDSEDLLDLRVGGTAEFDEWTLTIRSICADSVGFDAEVVV